MQHVIDKEVQALIIDVRGNRGGLDTVVPAMMSYFTPERLHYEDIAYYSTRVKALTLTSLYTKPNDQQFTKPVTVLVDHRTKSTGEGLGSWRSRCLTPTWLGCTVQMARLAW